MSILYSQPGMSSSRLIFCHSIVAVHGLNIPINGKAWKAESFGINTWVSDDPNKPGNAKFKKLWLKDFLPESFPRARVMVFGYNSNVGLNTSTAGVAGAADDLLAKLRHKRRDINDRPILFLCHSLGGIVVKLVCGIPIWSQFCIS